MADKIIPLNQKKNVFKITVRLATDRNPLVELIYAYDKDAEIKLLTDWEFKVKTHLSLSELTKKLISRSTNYLRFIIKKVWFF